MRGHAGERLIDIAREAALTPTTLRQRIARLRRGLRARFAGALAVALIMGGAALGLGYARTAQPAATSDATPGALYDGVWRVVDVRSERAGASSLIGTEVRVEGQRVRVMGPAGVNLRELSAEPGPKGSVLLRSGSESWTVTLEATDARHLSVTSERGTLRLERVDPLR